MSLRRHEQPQKYLTSPSPGMKILAEAIEYIYTQR